MTFQPKNSIQAAIASPKSINFVTFSHNVSATLGASISASSTSATLGASLTLSGGSVVLPSGYWYYIEGAVQAQVPAGNTSVSDFVDVQWYNGSAYVGSIGRTCPYDAADAGTIARDEKALALIDATSAPVSVTLRVVGVGGLVTVVNSTGTHYQYAGYSRAMIIQLEAP
jgi:hypothetical protein